MTIAIDMWTTCLRFPTRERERHAVDYSLSDRRIEFSQNRPIVRIRDRPRHRRSCSCDVPWLLNAQREGKVGIHFCWVQTHRYSTEVNTPQFAVQQCAAACCDIACCDIFYSYSLQYGAVCSICLRYVYVFFCVCLARSSLACVKLCLGSERENPRECFALESVG